jgi:hypothetical protein
MPHRQTVIPALDSLLSATVGENSASGIIRPLSKRGNLVNFIVERLGYGPHLPAVNSGPRQSFAANLTTFLSFERGLMKLTKLPRFERGLVSNFKQGIPDV